MRASQKSNRQRGRGRGGNKPTGNVVNRVFESAGPEGKVRGTPQQIIDKYLMLARDAQTSGDRVTAENFLQHAEHYQRMLIASQGPQPQDRREFGDDDGDDDGDYGDLPPAPREQAAQPVPVQQHTPQPVRAPQPASVPVATGMDMIEPIGTADESPLVETPEERTARRFNGAREAAAPAPAPAPAETAAAAPAEDPAPAGDAPSDAPADRPRRRRRRPAAGAAPEPAASGE